VAVDFLDGAGVLPPQVPSDADRGARARRQWLVALGLPLILWSALAGAMGYRAAAAHPGCGSFATVVGHHPVGDIVLLDANFDPCRQLTHDGQSIGPSISPDGRQVAYVSGRGYPADEDYGLNEFQSLYVVGLDGHDNRRLTQTQTGGPPLWSPDGRSLAVVTARQRTDQGFGNDRLPLVQILDARTGAEQRTVTLTRLDCGLVRWLDRTHLAESCLSHHHTVATTLSIDLARGGKPAELFRRPTLNASVWVPPDEALVQRIGDTTRIVVKDRATNREHVVPGSTVHGAGSWSWIVTVTSAGNLLWERHLLHQSYEVFLSRHGSGPPQRVWSGHHGGAPWENNLVDNPALSP
jgi:dipeptidyl aminopeptidase/acylaminoacyl peptidase